MDRNGLEVAGEGNTNNEKTELESRESRFSLNKRKYNN
jgi:hypothetical protein